MKTNQKGFSTLEVILILVIVGLVGFVGWYVYDSSQKTNDTYTAASKSSSSDSATIKKTESDDSLIIAAVKKNSDVTSDLIIKVDQIVGDNAKGTSAAKDGPGGSEFIAHKSDGKWSVIFQGQQIPGKNLGTQYNLPSDWYSTDY